eukprot:403372354
MIRNPSKRFGQVTNVIAFDQFNNQASNTNALTSAKQLQIYQQHKNNSSHSSINAKNQGKYAQFQDDVAYGKNELPPLWVDTQEIIEDKIAEAEKQFEKLKQLRALRFKPKFDENQNSNLDQQIDVLVTNLTETIKTSERALKQMMSESSNANSDNQIRKNIQQTYLLKLKEIAKQLRQIERENLMRIKDLYGEEGEIILNQLQKGEQDFFAELDIKQSKEQKNRDLIQLEHFGEMSEQRSEQITKLVNQINELAVVFKELSTLVVEQGSILDRIDFNIEQAHVNINKGNVELKKTLKREQSWRAKGCMSCLVTWNIVVIALLVVKHL